MRKLDDEGKGYWFQATSGKGLGKGSSYDLIIESGANHGYLKHLDDVWGRPGSCTVLANHLATQKWLRGKKWADALPPETMEEFKQAAASPKSVSFCENQVESF